MSPNNQLEALTLGKSDGKKTKQALSSLLQANTYTDTHNHPGYSN